MGLGMILQITLTYIYLFIFFIPSLHPLDYINTNLEL